VKIRRAVLDELIEHGFASVNFAVPVTCSMMGSFCIGLPQRVTL
jgi:hypothetical protein